MAKTNEHHSKPVRLSLITLNKTNDIFMLRLSLMNLVVCLEVSLTTAMSVITKRFVLLFPFFSDYIYF